MLMLVQESTTLARTWSSVTHHLHRRQVSDDDQSVCKSERCLGWERFNHLPTGSDWVSCMWSLGLSFCANITRLQWPAAVPPSCNVTLNIDFVVIICTEDREVLMTSYTALYCSMFFLAARACSCLS